MIKTLNPYGTNTAKTAEIMSRYRPIAPRPDSGAGDISAPPCSSSSSSSGESKVITQSPYLRNVWPQLQARPTRTRKRAGRSTAVVAPIKRHRSLLFPQTTTPCHVAFVRHHRHNQNLVTLPLMPPSSKVEIVDWFSNGHSNRNNEKKACGDGIIDLNRGVGEAVLEEKDFIGQLIQNQSAVIAPQPVRPVGSTISVRRISEDRMRSPAPERRVSRRRPEEAEADVEADELPAVISDSNNKVRMANSAYKELVGQPECRWLDAMGAGGRIGGEVLLQIPDSSAVAAADSGGFCCWVSIEWGPTGSTRSVDAFCDVIPLGCHSKDYVFSWRFHTTSTNSN